VATTSPWQEPIDQASPDLRPRSLRRAAFRRAAGS